jgi:hypothetical protein
MSKPIQRGILSGFLIAVTCYISVHAQSTTVTTTEKTNSTINNSSNQNGFPVYINTGNKNLDDSTYAVAKTKWIKEHPDEYPFKNSQTTFTDNRNAEDKKVEINFTPIKSFTLNKIEAVAGAGKTPTNGQLLAETENVKKDWPENTTTFELGTNNQVRLSINGKIVFIATEILQTDKVEWKIINTKCESCNKSLYLTRTESGYLLVYTMMSEDEGSDFEYKFHFVSNQ